MTDQVNIPLLRKAVEWAEAEAAKPDPASREWFQGSWVTYGRALAEDLVEDAYGEGKVDEDSMGAMVEALAPHCGTAYCIAGYIGQSLDERYKTTDLVDGVHVSTFAEQALGAPHREVVRLFDGGNTIKDVRRIAEDIAGERL